MPTRKIRRSPSEATPTIAFRVPAEMHEAAMELAKAQGVSTSELGRLALEAFLSNRRAGPTEGYRDARNRAFSIFRFMVETVRENVPETIEEFDLVELQANDARPTRNKRG